MRSCFLLLSLLLLTSCMGAPDGVQPVKNFDVKKYAGTWYEIARLDHSFEKNLANVTAEYSLRDDGGLNVKNRGYSQKKNEWKVAKGKAYFVDDKNTGHLRVSFWGPFYSSYVVFKVDEDYRYAFVSGYDKDYLWLLSRTPEVDDAVMDEFLATARVKGFAVDKLVYVNQKPIAP